MKILLKDVRKAKGHTLRELEELSRIPRSTISTIENETTSPTMDQMEALAAGLQMRITELFDSPYK